LAVISQDQLALAAALLVVLIVWLLTTAPRSHRARFRRWATRRCGAQRTDESMRASSRGWSLRRPATPSTTTPMPMRRSPGKRDLRRTTRPCGEYRRRHHRVLWRPGRAVLGELGGACAQRSGRDSAGDREGSTTCSWISMPLPGCASGRARS